MLYNAVDIKVSSAGHSANLNNPDPRFHFTLTYVKQTCANADTLLSPVIPNLPQNAREVLVTEIYTLTPTPQNGEYAILCLVDGYLTVYGVSLSRCTTTWPSTGVVEHRKHTGLLECIEVNTFSKIATFTSCELGDVLSDALVNTFNAVNIPSFRCLAAGAYNLAPVDQGDKVFRLHSASINDLTLATFMQSKHTLVFALSDSVLDDFGLESKEPGSLYDKETGELVLPNIFSWFGKL